MHFRYSGVTLAAKTTCSKQLTLQFLFNYSFSERCSLVLQSGLNMAMDFVKELERMAINATSDMQLDEEGPCADDIVRWQCLFSYT